MRDASRIREKIEIALDGRQVVTIVLGCAVVLGLVFWLGVNVGRDLAGQAPAAPEDPIARVDRAADAVDEHLTFPDKLVEPAPSAPSKPAAAPPAAPNPGAAPQAAPAAEAAPEPAAEVPAGETYTVQAGALPSRGEADAMVKALERKGLSAYVVVADIPGKGTFYRVRVGRFGTKDEADRYLLDFRRETGMDGFVTVVGK